MCIGNVDNEKGNQSKVVCGSLSGYLRIYYPRQPEYKIEDLMLEQQMGEPILQVEIVSWCIGNTDLSYFRLSLYITSS